VNDLVLLEKLEGWGKLKTLVLDSVSSPIAALRDILTPMTEGGKRLLRSALRIIAANGNVDMSTIDTDFVHDTKRHRCMDRAHLGHCDSDRGRGNRPQLSYPMSQAITMRKSNIPKRSPIRAILVPMTMLCDICLFEHGLQQAKRGASPLYQCSNPECGQVFHVLKGYRPAREGPYPSHR
jgi:hypothetical protein